MKIKNLVIRVLAVFAMSSSLALAEDLQDVPEIQEDAAAVQDEVEEPADSIDANDTTEGFNPQLEMRSLRRVSCTTQKYNTVGCINCTGSGEVRIVVDCKRPQITDFKGTYTRFTGSFRQCGECNFGINSVSYQARN